MAGKGFTDKGNRITPTSPFDWDTGQKLSAGEGAGTSDTTEATQLLVKTAAETTATNSTALTKTEDAAHASGDKGIMALVVRKDAATALAGTDGDYAPLEVDASGRLWVNAGVVALPAGAATEATLDRVADALEQPGAVEVALAQSEYEAVAASATNQALGASGATGDYLSHVTVFPANTSPGAVTIKDGSTAVATFAGGATSVPSLIPFAIPIGAKSVSGAWNITTGTNVSCFAVGDFT